MKKDIEDGKAHIFKLIPKYVEYDLNKKKKVDMVCPLLTGLPVSYREILDKLVVPIAHVGQKNESEIRVQCPGDCKQKATCEKLRQVYKTVHIIKERLTKFKHPLLGSIFKDIHMQLIGSLKEGTKILLNDELDIHLSIKPSSQRTIEFDEKVQTLFINGRELDATNYVEFYFECLYDIVNKIPCLQTSYEPCLHCMKMVYEEPQPYRCHHSSECSVHTIYHCTHKEVKGDCPFECDCRMFGNPSITFSKIGAVLHFGKR